MGSRASRRLFLIAAAVAVAAAAAALLVPVPVLRVTDAATGALLWQVTAAGGTEVRLEYINSLFDAPTTERFVVTGGLLRLTEISSTSQAVLEYLVLEPPYEERDGRFISRRQGPMFEDLTIRIGQTGRQRLVVGRHELPLYQLGVGEAARVRVTQMPRLVTLVQRQGAP